MGKIVHHLLKGFDGLNRKLKKRANIHK